MDATAAPTVQSRGKYRHIAFCFLPQSVFVLLAVGASYRGYWFLLPVLFLLIVVPLLDTVTGWQDDSHFERKDFSSADKSLLRWNTRLYAVFYLVAVALSTRLLPQLTLLERGFLLGSLGLIGAVGFSAAHELLHARGAVDQVLQQIMTACLFYPHYKLIHTQSHHAHVATSEDKNTAWLNESIYAYLFRTVPQSMFRCWEMEAARIGKRQTSGLAVILRNRMSWYAVGQAALLVALYEWSGMAGLAFYFGHIVIAHVVLESVNYIQHYGLLRTQYEGAYEMTAAEHSWDTYQFFSSYASFRVGHHSYHHLSGKPYYLLNGEPEAPKLPVGYFWAIAIVLMPPLWRRIINPIRQSWLRLPPQTDPAGLVACGAQERRGTA